MKKPYFTPSLIALLVVWQFFLSVKSLEAATISGSNNDSDVNTSIQHPTIFFENQDFNFGQIYKDQKVEHIYKFENRGKEILGIKRVKTSCGCTAAILTNDTIPPGETGKIKVTFSPGSVVKGKGLSQKLCGVLELHTNSEIQPVTLIRIIGKIE